MGGGRMQCHLHVLFMVEMALASMPLAGAITMEPCRTRLQCSTANAEVCQGSSLLNVTTPTGFCTTCGELQEVGSACVPPCMIDGGLCVPGTLAFDLNLDLKPPYYFQYISGFLKPTVQLIVFPKRRQYSSTRIGQISQLVFSAFAIPQAIIDFRIHWNIFFVRDATAGTKFAEWAIEMISSPNMVAAAAVFATFATFGEQRIGYIWTCYASFLSILYLLPAGILAFVAVPAFLCYFWISIPFIIISILLSALMDMLVRRLISRVYSRVYGAGYLNTLAVELTADDETGNLGNLFFWPSSLTLLAFLIPAEMRIFGGLGYVGALTTTFEDRHIWAYANSVLSSIATAYGFVALII